MNKDTSKQSVAGRAAKLLLAAALLAAGGYLSMIGFMGHEWLSRAGCLVVMLGIWSGLGGIIHEKLLTAGIRQKQRNAIVLAKAKLSERDADADTVEKELAEINEKYEAQLSHAANTLRYSVGFEEVALLLTGTFFWGFGDLFCCW